MKDPRSVAECRKLLVDCFGDHDRPMPPAGAADAHPQIALAFALKPWQEVGQQVDQPLDRLLNFTLRPKVFYNSWVPSGECPELRYEVWIRKKPHVKQHIEPAR